MKLVVRSGQDTGKEFPLTAGSMVIGKLPGNDIVITDALVSRRHAEIRRQGNQFVITDLGSRNGTYIDGRRIATPQVLRPGSQVRLGHTTLLLRSPTSLPAIQSRPPAVPFAAGLAGWDLTRGSLLLTGLGTLIVLLAFFLSWFHVSSPIANVFLAGLVSYDLSGLTLLTGFPELGQAGSPMVAVVPLLALGALVLTILRSFRVVLLNRLTGLIQIVMALLGMGLVLILLLGMREVIAELARQFGLPGIMGEKFISFDPAIGFWLTLLGFILIVGGGIWELPGRRLRSV